MSSNKISSELFGSEVEPPSESLFRKIVNNITIEPLVICWLLPFFLSYASVENMNVEKACREFVNSSASFDKDVCKIFVRKAAFNINCDLINSTINTEEINKKFPKLYESIKDQIPSVVNFLCETEGKVQLKLSAINAIRNPIAAIGPLIIILFAGPWSDKKNLRVPCMLVPFVGEAIGYLSEINSFLNLHLNRYLQLVAFSFVHFGNFY
jgi:PCFT/HCP family folate transporter-like MFS transporter 1/3